MARETKAQVVDRLREAFSKHDFGIFTDFRGLNTPELNTVRGRLRDAKAEYKVVKNTLARFAVQKAGKESLSSAFDGPIAIAFGSGEATQLARVLTDYIRTSRSSLAIRGGYLGNRLLTPGEVAILSALPSKQVLISKVMGGIQSPIAVLLGCLTAPLRGMVGTLQARIKQLEGGQNA